MGEAASLPLPWVPPPSSAPWGGGTPTCGGRGMLASGLHQALRPQPPGPDVAPGVSWILGSNWRPRGQAHLPTAARPLELGKLLGLAGLGPQAVRIQGSSLAHVVSPPNDRAPSHGSVKVARQERGWTSTGRGWAGEEGETGRDQNGGRGDRHGKLWVSPHQPSPGRWSSPKTREHHTVGPCQPAQENLPEAPVGPRAASLSGHNRKTLWLLSHRPPNGEAMMTGWAPPPTAQN